MAADMSTDSDEKREKCVIVLRLAMRDYMKCYEKMVDSKDQASRIRQYCESMKMALMLG